MNEQKAIKIIKQSTEMLELRRSEHKLILNAITFIEQQLQLKENKND